MVGGMSTTSMMCTMPLSATKSVTVTNEVPFKITPPSSVETAIGRLTDEFTF